MEDTSAQAVVEVACQVEKTEDKQHEMTGQDVEDLWRPSETLLHVVVAARFEYETLVEKAEATVASLDRRVQVDHDQAWEVCKLGEAGWLTQHLEPRRPSGTVQT